MPLSVNVGLSRKSSENYQSRGASINVVAELDATLLARPEDLQRQIAGLYAQAELALARRSASASTSAAAGPPANPAPAPRRESDGTNGERHPAGRDAAVRPPRRGGGHTPGGMTVSQRRAVSAIAARLGVDPDLEARDVIGVDLDGLSVRQASDLIDHLKGLNPAGDGGGGNGR
jgi:hypothetical protein